MGTEFHKHYLFLFYFCFSILYRVMYLTTVYSGTFLGEVGSVYSFISNYCV